LTLPDPDDAQIPGWAEGPNENTDDPEIYRERGYQDPDSFASADLNKNLQQIYRWIDTALEGGAARLTGDYGEVEIGNDDSSLFELVINAGSQGLANLTSWALDQIKVIKIKGNGVTFIEVVDQNDNASGFLLESLRAVTGINDLIKILDEDGNPGEGGLLLDILQAGTNGLITVNGSSGGVGFGGLELDFFRAGSAGTGESVPIGGSFSFQDENGNEGEGLPVGINTPKAIALIDFDPSTIGANDSMPTVWNKGLVTTYLGTGDYQFDLNYGTQPPASKMSGDVTFMGADASSQGGSGTLIDHYSFEQTANDGTIELNVFDDAGDRADPVSGKMLIKIYTPLS
jgi:hypothetical protein